MIPVNPIQNTNHRTAKTSQSSGFLILSKNWADSLLDFPELVSSSSYQTAIKQIPAHWVPYLVNSDGHRAEDPT